VRGGCTRLHEARGVEVEGAAVNIQQEIKQLVAAVAAKADTREHTTQPLNPSPQPYASPVEVDGRQWLLVGGLEAPPQAALAVLCGDVGYLRGRESEVMKAHEDTHTQARRRARASEHTHL